MFRMDILHFIFHNKSKIGSLNSYSHFFKSFNTNLNLLEQQRKKILEDVEKHEEAEKLIESDVEEETKKVSIKAFVTKYSNFSFFRLKKNSINFFKYM